MKLLKPLFVFICIFSFLISCKKKKDNAAAPQTSGSIQQFSTYPFGIGNEWEYAIEVVHSEGTDTTTEQYTKKYTHISDTSVNGVPCHKLHVANYNSSGVLTYSEYDYYANKTDGLYLVAAQGLGGGFMFFRQSKYHELLEKHLKVGMETSAVDSVFIPDSSLHYTKLPIVYNQSWRSFEYGPQFYTMRKWISSASASVPAGNYYCEKLQVILPNSTNSPAMEIYQYYSYRGLTKVETMQDSLVYGNGMTGFMRTKAELMSVNF